MMHWLDNAEQEMVDLFWQRCGDIEPYPRMLDRSISFALPLTLVHLPRLRLHNIEAWLQRRGIVYQFNCDSRAVRGCLVAYRGEGLIFIDGTDAPDERRFTIAHEVAHFLMDYLQPRAQAMKKLGSEVVDALDGLRSPTLTERVNALFTHARVGVYTNLMNRKDVHEVVWEIENRADRVALSLLAPPEAVLEIADLSARRFEQRKTSLTNTLQRHFGLPTFVADTYSHNLLTAIGQGPSIADLFRK